MGRLLSLKSITGPGGLPDLPQGLHTCLSPLAGRPGLQGERKGHVKGCTSSPLLSTAAKASAVSLTARDLLSVHMNRVQIAPHLTTGHPEAAHKQPVLQVLLAEVC